MRKTLDESARQIAARRYRRKTSAKRPDETVDRVAHREPVTPAGKMLAGHLTIREPRDDELTDVVRRLDATAKAIARGRVFDDSTEILREMRATHHAELDPS